MDEEIFPIVDNNGNVIGSATRKECHSGSMMLHPVVHLHIFKQGGYLYLQKRSLNKDIQPGKWDTAVGGHVDYGEPIYDALLRESQEELGLYDISPKPLISYIFQSDIEKEYVNTFYIVADNAFLPMINPIEIVESRFWHIDEIIDSIGGDVFTPNFEYEFQKIKHLIV